MTSLEAYATTRTGTQLERIVAGAGFLVALLLLRLPFRHTVRLVRLTRRIGHRPVERARAEALVYAVRHAARWYPGRAACLETSLGAVLAAALLGQRLDWCLGARFQPPPTTHHAWVELPVREPVGEYTTGGWHYHPVLVI